MKNPFLRKLAMVVIPVALLLSTVLAQSGTAMMVVDFNSIDASGGPVTGTAVATYLAGFGITMSGINGDPSIQQVATWENTSSSPNVFTSNGNYPSGSVTLNFVQPVDSVSFVRVGLSGPGGQGYMGAWSATAYSGASIVGSVSEPGYWAGEPSLLWKTFDLAGSEITSIKFDSTAIGTYLQIDDLTFNPVPIPGALVLFGSGLLGLVGIGKKRFKK